MMPVWMWNNELPKDSEVIIFDLDGVISDAAHRQHFLKGQKKIGMASFLLAQRTRPLFRV